MTRPADFDLAAALARKGFTPAVRDASALVAIVVAEAEPAATRATPALASLGAPAIRAIDAAFGSADDGGRARLIAVVGLLARAGDADARARLLSWLADDTATPRVRKAAAISLGKLGAIRDPSTASVTATVSATATATAAATASVTASDPDPLADIRAALLARWDAASVPADERRALAEALGKLGGRDAIARLAALDSGDDPELARRRDRALLMADRSARRDEDSEIRTDVTPPHPLTARLHCRPGLANLLRDELTALGIAGAVRGDARVDVPLAGPWSTLFASRLWATAGLAIALPNRDRARAGADDPDALGDAITAALTAAPVRALLAAWTRGPIRWRLGFARGHRRAVVWRVAREVAAAAPELINDPHATTWDAIVDDDGAALELAPRKLVDPRFAWRVAEVPAASHPTVAAALAWLAGAHATDRVWDPFTGSGAELIERARRGPFASLHGSDLDADALAAATANANAAALAVAPTFALADARTHAPGPVELIVTNPPLGGRLRGDAAAMLAAALPNLAHQLARGGRLVWITPAPRRTGPVAVAAGLRLARAYPVDLGGMRGQLERWDKP